MTVDFEDWYRTEYSRLVNTIALATGDRGVASDAASEACIRALARWDRVSRMSQPGGWIYKVALNDARRRLRKIGREREVVSHRAAAIDLVAPAIEPDHELWEAVARLPQRMREAVVLRYVADLTEPAIATALGVRRGTVATMLRRANDRLAVELSPKNGAYAHAFH